MNVSDKAKETLRKAQQAVQAKSTEFKDVFGSPQGKKVLADLAETFDPPILCRANSDTTLVRAAQRDVIRYINDMIEHGVKNEPEST